MRPQKAVAALADLKEEASTNEVAGGGEAFTAWKGKVRGVLVAALGKDDHLIERFDKVRYSLGIWTSSTPSSDFREAQRRGVRNACGVIDAAIYQLELLTEDDAEPTDARAYDPDLWAHVKNLVEAEDWGKVVSQTAIFVESHVRTWAGDPRDKNGESMFGKALYASVLSDASDLRLGARAGEREGWRFLAIGFAQAIGNVARHRIENREDARRYAIGVLGLGSLLLTQLRFEHPEVIEDAEDAGLTEPA